jgi:hypothetical protein
MLVNITLKDNKFVTTEGGKVTFNLYNSTIFDYTTNNIKIKSKSLDKIYPALIRIEKENELMNSFELTENGIALNMSFSNTISLKDIIDKRGRYNIECRLYTTAESRLLFKIIKIADVQNIDLEVVPEPDYIDILDIRNSIRTKIHNIKNKIDKLHTVDLDNMSLDELINLEDNLYAFIQNNI